MTNEMTGCYFLLTENCNLRCTYCFETGTRCVTKYMSEETAFKMVDFLFEEARRSKTERNPQGDNVRITFFGGEPCLCPEMMTKILRYGLAKEKETGIPVRFSLITNGTIYNDKVEAFLEEWYTSTRRIDIQVSMDGTPEIQDINRPCANKNLSSSQLVVEALEKFKAFYRKHNINPDALHIHTCIAKPSMPKLFEIYKYITYTLKTRFKFAWVFEDEWDDEDVAIFDRELEKITADQCRNETNANAFVFKAFNNCSGCASGRKLICVDCDGDIYPCHRFFFYDPSKRKDVIFGNIHDENPINIERRKPFIEMDESKITDEACQVCIAMNYCICGDMYKMPNLYNIEFMKIVNKYNAVFIDCMERKNTARLLAQTTEEVKRLRQQVNEMDHLAKRVRYLETVLAANRMMDLPELPNNRGNNNGNGNRNGGSCNCNNGNRSGNCNGNGNNGGNRNSNPRGSAPMNCNDVDRRQLS